MQYGQYNNFLIHPVILPEESLSGYLERLCKSNGYTNTSWLKKLLSSTIYQIQNNLVSNDGIDALSRLTLQPLEKLKQHGMRHWLSQIYKSADEKYILKYRVKYCPYCIKELPIHQIPWCFRHVTICIEHQCELIDACPGCSHRISLSELLRGNCKKCGCCYENTELEVDNIDADYFRSQVEMQEAMFQNKSILNDEVGSMLFPEFLQLAEASFHLLVGLQSFIGDHSEIINIFKSKKETRMTNGVYLVAFGNVWWMYQNFPNNFYIALDTFRISKIHSKVYMQKAQFEKILDLFPRVKDAYINYWINLADAGVVRRDFSIFKQDESILELRSMLRKDEVRAQTGLSYGMIQKYADAGKVDMSKIQEGKQTRYLVDRESLNDVLIDAAGYINKKEAAEILGIQRESVTDLIKAGLLLEVQTPYHAAFKKIRVEEVGSLLQTCRGEMYTGNEALIPFHEALIKYSVCGLSIERLLKFTIEKRINPKSKIEKGKLSENLYSASELKACVEEIKRESQERNGYYMIDVMKILKIGEKKMKSLMDREILVPDKIIIWKDGRKRYLFSQEQVASLKSIEMFDINQEMDWKWRI